MNSEVPILADVAPLIESKPSFIRELWPDSDPGISADGNDRLCVNRFSADIDFDVEDLKLYLDLSCGEEDPDKHLIDQKATELNDSENTSTCDHGTTSNHATEFPGDVNLLDERTSSGTWIDTESSEEADYNLIPSWRWSGIRIDSTHRMPHDTFSGKRQRGDSTWRRKWRNCNKTTELQVRRHRQKVKYGHNHKGSRSLHMIAYLILCVLKNQMMGPAMRKQKKPLACWRYSRTNTHGILWNQDLRDLRCTEHHSAPHANFCR